MALLTGKKVKLATAADGTVSVAEQADAAFTDIVMGALPLPSDTVLTGNAGMVSKLLTVGASVMGTSKFITGEYVPKRNPALV